MSRKASQPILVPFHGHSLFIIEHNNEPYVPMKPVVEGMGLTWQPQHEKLKANTKRWGITNIVIPSEGGRQSAACIPLRKLAGWLSTVNPKKVSPQIRQNIEMYQDECDDALWSYWSEGVAARARRTEEQVHSKLEWKQARLEGKGFRRKETDVIKEFVKYAISQGSKSAKLYYMNITKMTHNTMFSMEEESKSNGFRDILDSLQLMQLGVAEDLVARTMKEGMSVGLPYKEIFKNCKSKVCVLASALGTSESSTSTFH